METLHRILMSNMYMYKVKYENTQYTYNNPTVDIIIDLSMILPLKYLQRS